MNSINEYISNKDEREDKRDGECGYENSYCVKCKKLYVGSWYSSLCKLDECCLNVDGSLGIIVGRMLESLTINFVKT